MRDKLLMISVGIALLCVTSLSTISCKNIESNAGKEVPEPTRTSYSDDLKGEQLDATMLAMQGRKLSSEEVKKLEEKLEANPEDLVSRVKVLGWYSQKRFSSKSARKARQKHILWLIQNRPDTEIAGYPEAELDHILDKEAYYEAKKLWLEQVDKHNKNTAVIGNAASFFLIHEEDITEELLKKARAIEPENPKWAQQLGYLKSLEQSDKSFSLFMDGRKLSSQEVKKLEEKLEANPEDLISRTRVLGWYSQKKFSSESARKARQKHILWLIQNRPDTEIAGNPAELDPISDKEAYYEAKKLWLEQVDKHNKNTAVIGNAAKFFLIHDRDIAEELLKKAQALEPENPEWPERLGHLYSLGLIYKSAKQKTETAKKSLEQYEKSLSITTFEREKFYKLADLAKMAFEAGEMEKAETYANSLLAQAAQYKNDWNYGNAIHHGNIVLGKIALKSGDVEKAKEYLIKAGKTSGSPQLNSFGPNMALAKELLEKNEREVVIQYFELCGNFWKMGQDDLKDWIAIVKEEGIPDFGTSLSH